MAKAKKKTALKVVKTNAKPKSKGKEIKTSSLGLLYYKDKIEKAIIEKADNLLSAVKGIYGKQVPELSIAISSYLKSKTRISLTMLEIRSFVYSLVNYRVKTKFGENTKNQSFENNVTRAIQLSLLIENKKSGVVIGKDNKLSAISCKVYKELDQFNPKGKKVGSVKNTSKELVNINYDQMQQLFKSDVLGQKTNNKKKPTPKDNKVKTVTADNVINLMIKLLTNLNSLPKNKIINNIKGQTERNLMQIAKNILRLLAKKSVLSVSEDGKVTTINEVQFTSTYEKQNEWAKKHFNNAITSYSLEPVLKNTGTSK